MFRTPHVILLSDHDPSLPSPTRNGLSIAARDCIHKRLHRQVSLTSRRDSRVGLPSGRTYEAGGARGKSYANSAAVSSLCTYFVNKYRQVVRKTDGEIEGKGEPKRLLEFLSAASPEISGLPKLKLRRKRRQPVVRKFNLLMAAGSGRPHPSRPRGLPQLVSANKKYPIGAVQKAGVKQSPKESPKSNIVDRQLVEPIKELRKHKHVSSNPVLQKLKGRVKRHNNNEDTNWRLQRDENDLSS